jgi:hypothetical protein
MQTDDVRAGEKFVERARDRSTLPVKVRIIDDIVHEHLAVEGAQDTGQILTDMSATDDSDRSTGKLSSRLDIPSSGAEIEVPLGDIAKETEHKTECKLGYRAPIHSSPPPQKHVPAFQRR